MKIKIGFITTLIASSLTIPSAAFAGDGETEVQLYGVVDAGLAVTHVSGQGSHTGFLNGGLTDSLWGMRGQESLGNGWRASFQLESGFNPSSGQRADDTSLFNYGAWVGLGSDDLGEVRFGRQSTVGRIYGNALEIGSWKDMGMGATFKASDNYQFSNVVNYYTPSWEGFQFGAGYSFDADAQGKFRTRDNNRAVSVGMKYEQGPLLAVATWDQLQWEQSSNAKRPQAIQLGAAYDFEVVRLSAAWSRQSNGYVGLDGGDPDNLGVNIGPAEFAAGGSVNAWLLGIAVPLGQGTVLAQWSIAKPSWHWADGSKASTAQVMTLGYTYDLSKRTTLYTFAGYAKSYTLDEQFDPARSNTTRVGAGLTHRF